jgi:exodeoxyribonuclease VII small subunit
MASPAKPTPPKRPPAAKVADPAAEPARDGPAIDQVLVSLEQVVAELEAGDLPLETALQRFEDGVRLARRGTSLLDAVEQRVEVLLEGSDEPAPFPGAELTGDDDDDDV